MTKIERLLREYETHIRLPWQKGLAGAQKVIFVVYDKADELKLRARIEEFEIATKAAGHSWTLYDLTDSFPRWMAAIDYRDSYFESPEDIEGLLPQFVSQIISDLVTVLTDVSQDETSVVTLTGVACLFGFAHVSEIVQRIAPHVKGRLVVFFPGEHEGNNYRLLDARDGWNYLAVPIKVSNGL